MSAAHLGDGLLGEGGNVNVRVLGRVQRGVELVLYLADVAVERGGVALGAEGEDGEVDELGDEQAEDLGHGPVVDEARVAVLLHPVEAVVIAVVVIDRVVLAGVETDV